MGCGIGWDSSSPAEDRGAAKKSGAKLAADEEVGFSEYEHARDKPIEWPSEWPGLYADTSEKQGAYSYRVYVPATDFAKLNAFLDTRLSRGAVMIDLNQMAPSVRFGFPGERAWLKR